MLRLKRICLIAALALASGPLAAASITISDLQDVDFGTTVPSAGDLSQRTTFCVSVEPRGPFQITTTGSGAGGAFILSSGAGALNSLPYAVRIRGRQMIPGVPYTGIRAGPPGVDGSCRPPRFPLTIDIAGTDLARAPGGQYQGTLILTVAPE